MVAVAARAAGLAPSIVDDVTLAAVELARDALRDGGGEASVRSLATERDGTATSPTATPPSSPGEIGLSIARLISERVELASRAGAHTVRMTFAVRSRRTTEDPRRGLRALLPERDSRDRNRHDHLPRGRREGDVLPSLPREERPCRRLAATAGEPLVRPDSSRARRHDRVPGKQAAHLLRPPGRMVRTR